MYHAKAAEHAIVARWSAALPPRSVFLASNQWLAHSHTGRENRPRSSDNKGRCRVPRPVLAADNSNNIMVLQLLFQFSHVTGSRVVSESTVKLKRQGRESGHGDAPTFSLIYCKASTNHTGNGSSVAQPQI